MEEVGDTGDMDEETLGQALVRECWLGDSLATVSGEDSAMALVLEVLAMDMVVLVMVVATTTSRTPQQRPQQKTTPQ